MDILLLVLRLLLTALLYAFLGAVFLMLWRDLRQAVDTREVTRPRGRLVVLHAADEELAVGTAFSLQPVTSMGRSPGSTIAIPDAYASAQHALLAWREGQWWLEDRDSRNGVLLNGVRIDSPTVVSAGDVISIGRTEFKLELGDA
jgi:hypothetical protein